MHLPNGRTMDEKDRGLEAGSLRELAAAPPSSFVRTRNALVARLRKAGHHDQARAIATRRRPSAVLWLTNQLARAEPTGVRRLLDASDRLRRAQLRDPRALPEATKQHRAALQHLTRRAEQILVEAGMRRSADVSRRVQATLGAAAADRRAHAALRNGQLSEEIEAAGFDVLGEAPSRHLKLVTPRKDPKDVTASVKADRERKREERASLRVTRREAQAARRAAAKAKADAARRRRSLERATRQADRLREQLRAVEARIEQERRPQRGEPGASSA